MLIYYALCTENKCFSTIYDVLVGYENLGIQLSDTGKKKPEGHPLIIKLLLSLWLLYKNYINYYYCYNFPSGFRGVNIFKLYTFHRSESRISMIWYVT